MVAGHLARPNASDEEKGERLLVVPLEDVSKDAIGFAAEPPYGQGWPRFADQSALKASRSSRSTDPFAS